MTATRTLYRKANVTAAEATTSIFKRFPNVELVSFTKKEANAEEAKAARAKEGDLVYEATIRVAEFPPEGGDDSSSDEGSEEPKEEKKDEAPKEESGSDSDDSKDSDGDSDGDGDEFGEKGGDDPLGAEPKKLSPDEEIVHLLTQILHALKGGGGPMGHPGGPELGGDLPDIGAPGKGEELPPPPGGPHGGPGAPGAGGPPLPPPVKEKAPIGTGAFASVTGKAEVTMVREDAGTVGNKQILAEAAEHAPGHRVAKIQRTGIAQIGDDLIDLAEAKLALVTLVSR